MKKLLLAALFLVPSTTVLAHGPGYGNHYYNGNDWITPLVIGGVVGYIVAQPPRTVIQQPVIVGPQPIYQYQTIYDSNCGCYVKALIQIQ